MASMALSSINGAYLGFKNNMINSLPVVQSGNAGFKNKPNSTLSPLTLKGQRTLINVICKSNRDYQWRIRAADDRSAASGGLPLTEQAQELVKFFYIAINSKSTEKLNQILSESCALLGLIVHFPYDGKQNIVNYLRKVMDAMGPNIRVVAKSMSVVAKNFTTSAKEEENLTASVTWQLEWLHDGKANEIPFFAGTNEFGFERVDGKLFIRTITGVEDFPVKPKDLMQEKMLFSSASLQKLLKAISAGAEDI